MFQLREKAEKVILHFRKTGRSAMADLLESAINEYDSIKYDKSPDEFKKAVIDAYMAGGNSSYDQAKAYYKKTHT